MTDFNDNVPVRSVENRQVTHGGIYYVHACTERNDKREPIKSRPGKGSTKMRATRIVRVQPAERKTTKGEVLNIEKYTVEQVKDVFCRKGTT